MIRRKASIMMALLGGLLFSAFVLQDIRIRPELSAESPPFGLILRYGGAMIIGGAVSGYIFGGLFGRNGAGGWVLTILAGITASVLAGLFGSLVGLLPDLIADGLSMKETVSIVAGLLVLPLALIEQPPLALPVICILALTHLWCKAARSM